MARSMICFFVHLQLEFTMNRAGGQKHMNATVLSSGQSLLRPVDVVLATASQSTDGGAVAAGRCNR